MARLKQLTSDDVLLITKPDLARGVDYRAAERTHGIALLVMSASKSKRAYEQLLGRVGRYREPCLRYVWDGLKQEVDVLEQAKMLSQLHIRKATRRHSKQRHKQMLVPGQAMLTATWQPRAQVKPAVLNN